MPFTVTLDDQGVRLRSVRLLLTTALLLLTDGAVAAQTAPQKTWSFETADDLPPANRVQVGSGGTFSIDSTTSETGRGSLRLNCSEGDCFVYLPIGATDTAGDAIEVAARVKTELSGEDASVWLYVNWGGNGTSNWFSRIRSSSDWQTLSLETGLPAGRDSVTVWLELEGAGTAWFDQVTATPTDWTWLDQAREYGTALLNPFRQGPLHAVRALLSLLFLPLLLLGVALRSGREEAITGVTWPHRWFVMGLVVTVVPLSVAYFGQQDLPQLQWAFTDVGFDDLKAWAVLLGGAFTLAWWRLRARLDEVQLWRNAGLVLRYFLIIIFFTYSWAKIVRTQFAPITYYALDTRLGDLTPMQLLWLYFGYSYPYVLFVAAGQVTGAVLLAFRRTCVVGAIILFVIASNIVFVNYAYDIPVKFQSAVFLLMTIALIAEEIPRLWSVAVLRKRELPAPVPYRPGLPLVSRAMLSTLIVVAMAGFTVRKFHRMIDETAAGFQTLPFTGAWTVVDSTGAVGWKRLAVERESVGVAIQTASEDRYQLLQEVSFDEAARTFVMTWPDSAGTFEGLYDVRGDTLRLEGMRDGEPLALTLARRRFRLDPWR